MRNSRPKPVDVLFDDATAVGQSPLRVVQQRASALLKFNRAVKSLLSPPLQPWCRVSNYRQGILVLEIANASWMMRLRYEQPALLSALRARILPSLSSIDIRINPSLMVKNQKFSSDSEKTDRQENALPPVRQLSQQSAKELRLLASHSPEKLKKALKQLIDVAGESATSINRNKTSNGNK